MCSLLLSSHRVLTLDFSSSSKMMFLGRGGGGGKGASSGSFGSHFTIPAVETNGEVRRTHSLGDGTAMQGISSLMDHQTQLGLRAFGSSPTGYDPGLCFHGRAGLLSPKISSLRKTQHQQPKHLQPFSPSPFQCPICREQMSPPTHQALRPSAGPSAQLGAPRCPLLHLPLLLNQTDGCAGSGHRKEKVCFRFCLDKKRERANCLSASPFQTTASHLVSSASGMLPRSSPHEATLMSSCTSAPGSLTSLFLMCGCQDTGERENRWVEADPSHCKPGWFLSSPPPGEVRPFPTTQGEGKRKQARKAHEALATCPMLCLVFTTGNTRGGRNAAPAAPQRQAGTGGKAQAGLCHLMMERVLLTEAAQPGSSQGMRGQPGWEGRDCG